MLNIIKAKTSLGSYNKGAELAPDALIKHGLIDALEGTGLPYKILPPPKSDKDLSIKIDPRVRNHSRLTALNKSIYKLMTENTRPGNISLLLGGDHSTVIGSLFASKAADPKTVVVYIDAHPDCQTPATSLSGNMHGMSLSTVLGDSLYNDYRLPKYEYDEAFLLGVKDIDADEEKYIRESGITAYTIRAILRDGIGKTVNDLISLIGDRPVHVSLDVDSVDMSEAPGTGVPNKGGLSYREIRFICESLSAMDIRAIDLVEINPKKDVGRKTEELGIDMVLTLLGKKWSPYERYMQSHKR